jgi:diadenosine tetraphosphate (Ap4A) HIT family hydrolase
MLEEQRAIILKQDETVSGFNVGANAGGDAGQTIFHVHVHLIPRRAGDVAEPRGGVRGVIPERQSY